VYESIDELMSMHEGPCFNVFIIEKTDLEKLSDEEKGVLSSLLFENVSVLIKDDRYENYPYEDIKLIIWDMDDTFWQGTLSEGEIILPLSNAELIRNITDHGVVNSISSKNDEDAVISELEKAGVAELFVFNNINWEEKGSQIKAKIEAMKLRSQNVLFIDDNARNLEEARHYCPELMTAGPEIIPYLSSYFVRTKSTDISHDRLAHYKILEDKRQEREKSVSEEEFLFESNITLSVNRNCLEEIDRIYELVQRSNQLNYTKNRDHKEILTRLITNDWNDCAYIRVKDKYGDYGIVGFYCFNTREKKMEHFLFSCRILGMGVEQYIYNRLGCPDFNVEGKVSSKLEKNKLVPWIQENTGEEIISDSIISSRVKVLLKGPCDLDQIAPYLSGGNITTEFNYVNEFGFITTGQNHSEHIWECRHMTSEEIEEMIKDVPFITDGDFKTKIFDEEYKVICYSLLQDVVAGLYKNKRTGKYISFGNSKFPLTDVKYMEGYLSKQIIGNDFNFSEEIIDKFAADWEFVGSTSIDMLFRNLDYIYENVKGKPVIILLLGSEVDYEGEDIEFGGFSEIYRQINPAIEEFAIDHDRIRVINMTE
jgi:FkbH-like protein